MFSIFVEAFDVKKFDFRRTARLIPEAVFFLLGRGEKSPWQKPGGGTPKTISMKKHEGRGSDTNHNLMKTP
jgi:hypothetical protein